MELKFSSINSNVVTTCRSAVSYILPKWNFSGIWRSAEGERCSIRETSEIHNIDNRLLKLTTLSAATRKGFMVARYTATCLPAKTACWRSRESTLGDSRKQVNLGRFQRSSHRSKLLRFNIWDKIQWERNINRLCLSIVRFAGDGFKKIYSKSYR